MFCFAPSLVCASSSLSTNFVSLLISLLAPPTAAAAAWFLLLLLIPHSPLCHSFSVFRLPLLFPFIFLLTTPSPLKEIYKKPTECISTFLLPLHPPLHSIITVCVLYIYHSALGVVPDLNGAPGGGPHLLAD